ncbi:MAG: protein methyltransferase, partial [Caulobacter vibrioides]
MNLEAFIRERLPLEPTPGVPEVRLHRAGPRSGLSRLAA